MSHSVEADAAVKDSDAAAHNRLLIELPCQAEARREIVLIEVREGSLTVSAVARLDERAVSRAARRVVEERLPVFFFALACLQFVAQAEIHSQLRRNFPTVVEIAAVVIDQECAQLPRRNGGRTRQTEQQVGHCVAGPLPRCARGKLAIEIEQTTRLVRRACKRAQPPVGAAEFHRVPAPEVREVVIDLEHLRLFRIRREYAVTQDAVISHKEERQPRQPIESGPSLDSELVEERSGSWALQKALVVRKPDLTFVQCVG